MEPMFENKKVGIVLVLLVIVSLGFNFLLYLNQNKYSSQLMEFGKNIEEMQKTITEVQEKIITTEAILQNQILEVKNTTQNLEEKTTQQLLETRTYVEKQTQEIQQKSLQDIQQITEKIVSLENQTTTKSNFSQVIKSVVKIKAGNNVGSGVIIDEKGYVITNYHLINLLYGYTRYEKVPKIRVWVDNEEYTAKKIASDSRLDIALLKLETPRTFQKLDFISPKDINVGDTVYAVGYPGGLNISVTKGIVSALNIDPEGKEVQYIQTDVPINPGNSGGPLVNEDGKILGINTLKLVGLGYEGMGFAVQSNLVVSFVNNEYRGLGINKIIMI